MDSCVLVVSSLGDGSFQIRVDYRILANLSLILSSLPHMNNNNIDGGRVILDGSRVFLDDGHQYFWDWS